MSSGELGTIVVFGAGGRLGRHLVVELLARGHQVRAVVHTENPLVADSRLEIVTGDVRDAVSVANCVRDATIVMASLGSMGQSPPDVASQGARSIVNAMIQHGQKRLVSVTGSGAALPGERLARHHLAKRTSMQHGAPHLLADGERHLTAVGQSQLDWTVIRVPFMTSGHRPYRIGSAAPDPSVSLPYSSAAEAMVDLAATEKWVAQAPFVY